jgi:hypothetical protein
MCPSKNLGPKDQTKTEVLTFKPSQGKFLVDGPKKKRLKCSFINERIWLL